MKTCECGGKIKSTGHNRVLDIKNKSWHDEVTYKCKGCERLYSDGEHDELKNYEE